MSEFEQASLLRPQLDIRSRKVGGQKLLAVGGLVAALGAASCCVLPLALLTLGVGGAWMGNLTALAPYEPFFMGAAVVILAFAFWRVYRSPANCADGSACSEPRSTGMTKAALWAATLLVIAAAAFPYVAPYL
ncbi:Mercuric transport protein MerT precursor [Sphingopyxis sp. LC81]|uniref:mercuric transporter MerT family protein n=1 Tax=Sphingopyxis sp. LC81 TaxID=1502850 RepID=UPI00050FE1EF|nr:mercuric transporter MerT family protein [Sphingopyxis sp. LC81]KGB53550.1 Mercuric transport protein MerT precursor [Sphingopyxis sp. LC81]